MKKIMLVSLVLLTGILNSAYSQGFHLGFKAGANLFKIDGQAFKEGFNFGYNLGGFAEINISKKLGIQPEVLWSQSSYKTASNLAGTVPELSNITTVKLDYLQIPLLLNLRPSKFFTVQLGPQYSIKINDNLSVLQNGKEAFKNGDFSLLGGVQLNLAAFKVGGRYVVGLNNIGDLPNQGTWKNSGFQLYAGFRFF